MTRSPRVLGEDWPCQEPGYSIRRPFGAPGDWISRTWSGTTDALSLSMTRTLIETVILKHRVESSRREAAWMDELAKRRAEISAHARIDIDALRVKLAI